jgi:hypothetical protein
MPRRRRADGSGRSVTVIGADAVTLVTVGLVVVL